MRALSFLVHNWPLKMAAVVMAALLYGVFVVTQNTRILDNQRIPIAEGDRPDGVVLLSPLGAVTQVRYFSNDPNVQVTSATFTARADLSGVDPDRPTNIAEIEVTSIDPRVEVIEWQPPQVSVQVEQLEQRSVDVRVERLDDPDGFDIREADVTPSSVIVEGPASLVRRVDAAVATVQIDPAGLDFDRDVELIPVDVLGEQLAKPAGRAFERPRPDRGPHQRTAAIGGGDAEHHRRAGARVRDRRGDRRSARRARRG